MSSSSVKIRLRERSWRLVKLSDARSEPLGRELRVGIWPKSLDSRASISFSLDHSEARRVIVHRRLQDLVRRDLRLYISAPINFGRSSLASSLVSEEH